MHCKHSYNPSRLHYDLCPVKLKTKEQVMIIGIRTFSILVNLGLSSPSLGITFGDLALDSPAFRY